MIRAIMPPMGMPELAVRVSVIAIVMFLLPVNALQCSIF
jgi:hypothetical protein